MTKHLTILIVLLGLVSITSCSKLPPEPILTRHQIADDRQPIEFPKEHPDLKQGEVLDVNSFARIERIVDVRTYGKLIGNAFGGDVGSEAANANLFDDVPDSTWFTNRNARVPLSPEEIERGPSTVRLASEGNLRVVSGKSSGVTLGFVVKDANGNRFVLKFDNADYCGLASGADVIGSRLFHAAGYNVPENNIENITLDRFIVDPKAKTFDKYNRKVQLTEEIFADLLKKVPDCKRKESYRVMASRFLDGRPAGPFSYQGRRSDDANDKIRHQNRRELRGLTVMAAWLNHTDFRDYNSLDMFHKTEGETGYLVHHLIDFGGTLGAGSPGPKGPISGKEHMFDFRMSGLNTLGLGFRETNWEKMHLVTYPSVGNYRAYDFDPKNWVPTHPNPVFWSRTARDGFWGARLVASFTDEQLMAAVQTAELPDEGATEEMIRVLAGRRDRTAAYWFGRVGGLDNFSADGDLPAVSFDDWNTRGNWKPKTPVTYQWTVQGKNFKRSGQTTERPIPLFENAEQWNAFKEATGKAKYLRIRIQPSVGKKAVAPWTEAYFYLNERGTLSWVGLTRHVS